MDITIKARETYLAVGSHRQQVQTISFAESLSQEATYCVSRDIDSVRPASVESTSPASLTLPLQARVTEFAISDITRGHTNMPRVAVAGSSGAIGRLVVAHLRATGHTPVELSRSSGVNLLTGDGLSDALAGNDVVAVIDASQVASPRDPSPTPAIVDAARGLLAAMQEHKVPRYVMLSIYGVQNPVLRDAYPFYEARWQQELVTVAAKEKYGVEGVVVRSPQWFEFALNPAAATEKDTAEGKVIEVQDWWIRPCSMQSVADFMVEAALKEKVVDSAEGPVVTVTGKDRLYLVDLTTRYVAAKGVKAEVRRVDALYPAYADGSLNPGDDAIVVGPTLEDWLRTIKPDD